METAAASLRTALRGILKLRPGEGFRVGMMFLYSLAAIGGVYILGREVSRTLFLTLLPEGATPFKFILPPFFIVATSVMYARVAPRYKLGRLIIGTSLVMIVGMLFFRYLLSTTFGQTFAGTAALYVYFEVVINLVGIQFWTYAVDIFNPREAKRVFGLVAAGGVLGNAVSGFGLRLLVPILPAADMIFIVAGSLFIGLICVWLLERRQRAEMRTTAVPQPAPEPARLSSNLRAMAQSPLLLNIGAILVLSAMIKNLAAYQMDLSLQRFFATDAQAMLTFLANFQIVTGVLAVGIQLFATNRILSKFGLIVGLLLLPLGVMLGSTAFLITGGALWAMALPRGADIVFRFTIDDSAVNILFLPVPADLRRRAKATIEGVVKQPMIAVLGVLFLIFLRDDISQVGVQAPDVVPWSIMMLGVIAVWIVLILRIRRQYTAALAASLQQRRLDLSNTEIDPSDETTKQVLVDRLHHNDEMQILNALTLIAQVPDSNWQPHVAPLLMHSSLDVRLAAARYLAADGRMLAASTAVALTDMLADPEPAARAAAIEALCASQGVAAIPQVAPFLHAAPVETRQAAIAGLIKHGGLDGMLHAASTLKEMLDSPTAVVRQTGAHILGQLQIQTFYQPLLPLLVDADPAVRASAIQAAGQVGHPDLLPHLLAALHDETVANTAVTAIVALGPGCEPVLADLLGDITISAQTRLHVPKILRQLQTPAAATVLLRHLHDDDAHVRATVLKALARLQSAGVPFAVDRDEVLAAVMNEVGHYYRLVVVHADFGSDGGGRLLDKTLHEHLAYALDRLFYLLRLVYPEEAMTLVRRALAAEHGRYRPNAIELLDNVADRDLRGVLLPLLEAPLPQLLAIASAKFDERPRPMTDRLAALLVDPDPWLRACAIFRIGELGLIKLAPLVATRLDDEHDLVRETAVVVHQHLADGAPTPWPPTLPPKETIAMTLSTIERIFFLRGVELFSQVDSEDLVSVAQVCHETYFAAGEQFITQGDLGDCLYILVDGEARVVLEGPGDIFYRVSRDILGEMAIISRKPRSAHCIAVTPITALRIDHDDFWELIAEKPALAQGVIKVLANRLDETVAQLSRTGGATTTDTTAER